MLDIEPTQKEKRLVWRCMNDQDIHYGDQDYIWSQGSAYQLLVTLRLCVESIVHLTNMHNEVTPDFVKTVVIQTNDLEGLPFCLDEMSMFLCIDAEAKSYWSTFCFDGAFPHKCPFCGAAAYIGLRMVDCRAMCRD